jgi:hypothetical protein
LLGGVKCSAMAVPVTAMIVSPTTKAAISFMAPVLSPKHYEQSG